MKIIRSADFLYTLYEDNNGSFVLDLAIPAAQSAWANYEKKVVLSAWEKILIKVFPRHVDRLVSKLVAAEKRRQQVAD